MPKTFTVSVELHSEISYALSCRLDDLEKEIKAIEKSTGEEIANARGMHARLQYWLLKEFNPQALSGKLKLLDGTEISPLGKVEEGRTPK